MATHLALVSRGARPSPAQACSLCPPRRPHRGGALCRRGFRRHHPRNSGPGATRPPAAALSYQTEDVRALGQTLHLFHHSAILEMGKAEVEQFHRAGRGATRERGHTEPGVTRSALPVP